MSAHAAQIPSGEALRIPEGHRWRSYPMILGSIGLVALVAAFFISRISDPEGFWFSYLVAFMYGLSLALGGLFFVIVQFLVKAGWSVVVRRIAENVMGTLPLFAVLFLLVAVGLPHTHAAWWNLKPGSDPLVDAKAGFLNPTFFYVRAVIYLAIWISLALGFRSRSLAQDKSGDQEITYRQQFWSAPALILFALSVTFAAIDWMKSMEPHWFSTMWGVYYFAGSTVSMFAALSLLALWLQSNGFVNRVINTEHFHDLGKLIFGFIVFWAYITFSQYFLIWYANIPEETVWFAQRMQGGWLHVGQSLIVCHFAIPFFFMLPRGIKRNRLTLAMGAAWMLAFHYVDLYYVIMPVHDAASPKFGLVDLLTLLGVVSLFVAAFARLTAGADLIPVGDPRLPESLAFENS